MTNTKIYYIIAYVALIVLLAFNTLLVVHQGQYVIIFQFGSAKCVIKEPGLHIKIPFIQNAEFFDGRILNVDVEAKELTAVDGKRMILDTFAQFQIDDVIKFYQTVYNYHEAKIRLSKILESCMRQAIGVVLLTDLLSEKRTDVIESILSQMNKAASDFGIKIINVCILHLSLPSDNSTAIYQLMQSERIKEAKQIRAEGQERADEITSSADHERKKLLADAHKRAQTIMGDGDAKAYAVYNTADSNFFKFYKTLLLYEEIFRDDDYFILPTNGILNDLWLDSN